MAIDLNERRDSVLKKLAVDSDRMTAIALTAQGHHEWVDVDGGGRRPSEVQSKDPETGVPLWSVACSLVYGDSASTVNVIVPSAQAIEIEPGETVTFADMRVELWSGRSGLGGRFFATTMETAA